VENSTAALVAGNLTSARSVFYNSHLRHNSYRWEFFIMRITRRQLRQLIKESLAWKSFLPEYAIQISTIENRDKSTNLYAINVPREIYEPVLSSFYKVMGAGDEEKGLQKVSQKSVEDFITVFPGSDYLRSYSLELYYKNKLKDIPDSPVAYEAERFRAKLVDNFVEKSIKYYDFVQAKMKEKSGVWQPDSYLLFSEIKPRHSEINSQPELIDLDKALTFYGQFV
tara:strand:- start:727 stop:1401 length:675 start_codon:yes stop_codon:yes gene_type:complete